MRNAERRRLTPMNAGGPGGKDLKSRLTLIGVLLGAAALAGCSKLVPKLDEVIPDNRKDYQRAQTLPDLEVPPDLSTEAIRDRMAIPEGGEAARYSTYQERRAERQRAEELEKSQTAAIRVLENEHVLAVQGAPVQVWPRLQSFWEGAGYALELNDVELGIIETSWQEDEAELVREKFKLFAEAGEEAGTTVLYISHEAQELVPQGEDLVWQRKPRDEQFERQMVERLDADLNGTTPSAVAATPAVAPAPADTMPAADVAVDEPREAIATPAAAEPAPARAAAPAAAAVPAGSRHAELVSVGGGKFYLTVAEDFPKAWKSTARALESVGVDVKDSDKGRGVYVVEVAQGAASEGEDGVWGKLKFWDRGDTAELQVSLTGVGEKTEVVVLDKNGRWETGDHAGNLLNKLHDAFNRI